MSDSSLVWFKGHIAPLNQANISIASPSAQFGLNVFEGIRGYLSDDADSICLFRLSDHLERLNLSLRIMGLSIKYSDDEIFEAIQHVLHANSFQCDVALRVLAYLDDLGSWHKTGPTDMFIQAFSKNRLHINSLTGSTAMTSSYRRIDDQTMPPRVKTGANYINSRYAFLEAQNCGFNYPFLLNSAGQLTESSGSCICLIYGDSLITPPTTSSNLESITRATVVELASRMGLNCDLRPVDRTELYLADEIFICGSAVELTPITVVDRFTVSDGKPGPYTLKLLRSYHKAVVDKDSPWVSSVSII